MTVRIGLVPSPDDALWRHALADAAAQAGLSIAFEPSGEADPAILLSAWFGETGPAPDVVLMPDASGAVAWAEAAGHAQRPHSVSLATGWLASAAALPGTTRVLGARDLKPGVQILEGLTLGACPEPASPPSDPALARALGPYLSGRPPVGEETGWEPSVFLGEASGLPAGKPMDITGPPRSFIYGPYIALPPGLWRATVSFDIDAEAAALDWRIDWGRPDEFQTLEFRPGKAGRFSAVLEQAWSHPAPAEVRLTLLSGSIGGAIALHGVQVQRLA